MKKRDIRQIVAAVLILCTFFHANILSRSVSEGVTQLVSAEIIQREEGQQSVPVEAGISDVKQIFSDEVIATEGLRCGIWNGMLSCKRMERRTQSVLYIILAVLFKTAVISCLIFGLILAAGDRKRSVWYQILTFVHKKDGKKGQVYFI